MRRSWASRLRPLPSRVRSDGAPDIDGDAPDFGPFGLAVGHATDDVGATGCTVVRGIEQPFRAAAVACGRATGTRELDVASARHLVDRVDAILLTGGSAYGLDAAAGVMRWMEERRRGFDVGVGVVPIVPAAVVFDLAPLGQAGARPTAQMAYAACDTAVSIGVAEGSVGAGTGATVGKAAGPARAMKGGLGIAAAGEGPSGVIAIAVVNAFGDVRDGTGRILAGARDEGGGFVDAAALLASGRGVGRFASPRTGMQNTTLAVVAVQHAVDRVALEQLARAAGAALFRRITPCGTTYDGDVVFAICPATAPAAGADLLRIEVTATAALERAIERGVRLARGRDGVRGVADDSVA